MGVVGSVNASLNAGSNTVTFPGSGLQICAIKVIGPVDWISIPIDSSTNAIFPSNGAQPSRFFKVNFTMKGNVLNVTANSAGNVLFYYGTPFNNTRPLTAFAAVAQKVSYAASGSTTQNLTVVFPGGKRKLTGVMIISETSGYSYQAQFASGTGDLLTVQNTDLDVVSAEDTIGVDNLSLPDTLSVSFIASSTVAANNAILVMLYA